MQRKAGRGEMPHSTLLIVYVTYPVFVCTAALAILDRLDVIDQESLAWWLSERQLPNGGLNGRPEKLEDVGLIQEGLHIRTELFVPLGLLQLLGSFRTVDPEEAYVD